MDYIIDFKPVIKEEIDFDSLIKIENKIKRNESLTSKEISYFLDTIIYMTRLKINSNMDNYDYTCDLAQSIICYYLNSLNCETYPIATRNITKDDIVGHNFLCAKFKENQEEKLYLIDPTYIQFFKKENCNKDKYFISKEYGKVLLTPDPGYFIRESQKEDAKFLLNHGYIILNEETAMMYGDSFINTKRGRNIKECTYESLKGNFYIESFLKEKTNLSKKEEELKEMNYLIEINKESTKHKR